MSKAKAKADASAQASTSTLDVPPEISETPPAKKRVARRTSTSASSASGEDSASAPAKVSVPVTLPPAPVTATPRARRKAAAPETPAAAVPAPLVEAVPAPAARSRRKAAAPTGAEQLALSLPDDHAEPPAAKPVRKRAARAMAPAVSETPAAPASSSPAPAPTPASLQERREQRDYAPAPREHRDDRDERPRYNNDRGSSNYPQAEAAPARSRRLDPEEEIAEAIVQARKAQAEANALHAEARAKAAEAKAREAEARLRAAEARARASGIDPFSDMDGESVIEKAPPIPGQGGPQNYRQGGERPQQGHQNYPRDNRSPDGGNYGGQGGGQGQTRGPNGPGGQQGGQGNRGNGGGGGQYNQPSTVFQGHGGNNKPSKRDKFEWKKNKNRNKPGWQPNGPGGQQGGGQNGQNAGQQPRYGNGQGGYGSDQRGPAPVAQPGVEGEETWRPGGEQGPAAAPAPAVVEAREDGAPVQGRPERPERPPLEDRPVRDPEFGEGIIEISGKGKGFGFLRESVRNYNQSPADVFVTPEIIRKHNLKDGMKIYGETRRGNRGPQLYKLITINGENPEKYRKAPAFEELTVINPMERIRLETVPERYTTRIMDMMTPIGKGQRGLIVAPPRTGKTTMLQNIAEAICINYPDMPLILMLIDERPEEVTELRRALPKAEVIASSNDSDPRAHLRTAQLGIERAKRLVEGGHDVFMLLDSITRMGRAFNNAMHPGGKTGSGGIDSKAMEIPRKIFAAARNTEEAGSLTIIATALVDTGSKGDEYIFQEFKGTGNMEVVLDRKISDQLIFPAIDIFQSGTRREELILPPFMLDKINTIRRGLSGSKSIDAISRMLMFLRRFPTNFELLNEIPG